MNILCVYLVRVLALWMLQWPSRHTWLSPPEAQLGVSAVMCIFTPVTQHLCTPLWSCHYPLHKPYLVYCFLNKRNTHTHTHTNPHTHTHARMHTHHTHVPLHMYYYVCMFACFYVWYYCIWMARRTHPPQFCRNANQITAGSEVGQCLIQSWFG